MTVTLYTVYIPFGRALPELVSCEARETDKGVDTTPEQAWDRYISMYKNLEARALTEADRCCNMWTKAELVRRGDGQ